MVGINGGFIQFVNLAYGLRALGIDLRTKINTGYNTIEKLITRYAPPVENDTAAYILAVSDITGLSETRILRADIATLARLVRAIITHENGAKYAALVTAEDINEGLAMMRGGPGFNTGTVGFGVATGLFILALYLLATMPKMKQ